ncbi:pyocin activator PrtN family protein [Agrobacterium fabrum]|nr:pyocin activator PrtN family protein [Agrobacterium fabrum]
MAQYIGRAVIPVQLVCRDFFSHLTVNHLVRKATRGHLSIMRSASGSA